MKSVEEARELARTMVDIGKSLGRKTIAVVTDMSQPLGHEVGNANEVAEAVEILKGKGAPDETEVALTIASYMAVLGEAYPDFDKAYSEMKNIINSGKAIEKLKELVKAQGGNPEVIDDTGRLPKPQFNISVKADFDGFVSAIDAENIGVAAMLLGAGRKTKTDNIDFSAGVTISKKVGDPVNKGDVLCILHTSLKDNSEAEAIAKEAFSGSNIRPEPIKYIKDVIK